ncbi:MAG: hypothetical protein TH68_09455 [Candidatus Synechococcus spongiarum 142]|uniref:SLH domain-containing protein n=1 Tax=Candidatus Synechococcus spongiarum 142 TaxID=1608213 RepID=A0A6N3XB55_9SYNE|nr:MAG: hypothetical protein TH68_09455 [Candidatus Synechococcus spongiarum 142]
MGKWASLRRRWRHLLAAVPLALVVGIAPADAIADDLEPDKGQQHTLVAQVSSPDDSSDDKFVSTIDQFSDVEDPKQWTTENLEELVDTYQCVAGFPDGTFRGEQSATRFEVATLLKACLNSSISIHEGQYTHPSTEHNHESAEHKHPINTYILASIIIGIIAFIIYQYTVLMKIRKLEKDNFPRAG